MYGLAMMMSVPTLTISKNIDKINDQSCFLVLMLEQKFKS